MEHHAKGVSVIIPMHNGARTIKRALSSVQAQSVQADEILVSDDGSTDDSVGVISAVKDERIRVLSQSRQGPGAARNRAAAEASGDILALLDCDDEWQPTFLEETLSLLSEFPEAQAATSGYQLIYPDGLTRQALDYEDLAASAGDRGYLEDYFAAALGNSPICCSSAVILRSAYRAIGGFRETLDTGEDLVFWTLLAERWPIAVTKRILVNYHYTPTEPREPRRSLTGELEAINTITSALSEDGLSPARRRSLDRYRGSLCLKNAFAKILRGEARAARATLRRYAVHRHSPMAFCRYYTASFLPLRLLEHIIRWKRL